MNLYKISFSNTEKVYIGITSKTIEHRFNKHKDNYSKTVISHAIRKNGLENTKLTKLGECDNWELLCLAEQEAILKFNSKYPNGYNITDGGEGSLGHIHSDETKAKIGKAHKGKKISDKQKAFLRTQKTMLGKNHSEESKEKIRQVQLGRKASDETRLKMRIKALDRLEEWLVKRKEYLSNVTKTGVNKTKYNFINIKSNEIDKCTQHELIVKYGLDPSSLTKVMKNKRKHVKNWSVIL